MAEIVQKQMETMTVELESMFCTKLYTAEEIRRVMKKRSDFEYKINGQNKNPQDFREFILYEQTLLRDVRLRRDKLRIGEKKDAIEHRIIKRIRDLYEMAIRYFPSELFLYIQFFKFCKQVKYVNATNNIITKMIQKFHNDEKVWYMAAGWYAYDCKDLPTAREIILKGLSVHKNFELLYKEGIHMELFFSKSKKESKDQCDIKNEDNNAQDEEILRKQREAMEKVKVYLKFSFDNVKRCEFYIEILELLENYKFTEEVQHILIKHLLNKHSTSELVWHKLAWRETKGLHYSKDTNSEYVGNSKKRQLVEAISKFKEGVEKVSVDRKEKMWSLYLDFLLEMQHDILGIAYAFKLSSLREAFEHASKDGFMSEKYYIHWLECANNDEEGLKITEEGIKTNPESVFLWKARLRYVIMTEDDNAIKRVFEEGREKLKEKALPLWNALVRYNLLKLSSDEIENVFKRGMNEPGEVGDSLKSQYVEWLATTKDVKAARELYKKIARVKPYSKKLHNTMLKMEMMELEINTDNLKEVYKIAIEQFGHVDVDVWINYCQFFIDFSRNDLKQELQKVYEDAVKSLPVSLQDEFIDRFSNCKEDAINVERF